MFTYCIARMIQSYSADLENTFFDIIRHKRMKYSGEPPRELARRFGLSGREYTRIFPPKFSPRALYVRTYVYIMYGQSSSNIIVFPITEVHARAVIKRSCKR